MKQSRLKFKKHPDLSWLIYSVMMVFSIIIQRWDAVVVVTGAIIVNSLLEFIDFEALEQKPKKKKHPSRKPDITG
jgi:hypothetical protein